MISETDVDAIRMAFRRLYAENQEETATLWNALYDWSIELTYCIGAIEAVAVIESDMDEKSTELLQKAHAKLDHLTGDMRSILAYKENNT